MSEKQPQYYFEPQEDITAYELAHILKLMMPFADPEQIIKKMPPNCMRHLILK